VSALTTKLSLYKPGGGSTGLIFPDEVVDIDKINSNMDKIDAVMGAPIFTSVTRPATPFLGQIITESDTGSLAVYGLGGAQWQYPNSIPVLADLNALPTASAFEGRRFHIDSMNVDFQAIDNVWVQQGTASFATSGARDTEYAKAAGIYLVYGVRARLLDTGLVEEWCDLATDAWQAIAGGVVPKIRGTRSAAQSIPNATDTAIDFTVRTAKLAPCSYAASTFTFTRAGRYGIKATWLFDGGLSGGYRAGWIKKNAASIVRHETPSNAAIGPTIQLDVDDDFAVNDTLQVMAFQSQGTAVNILVAQPMWVEITYLGPRLELA